MGYEKQSKLKTYFCLENIHRYGLGSLRDFGHPGHPQATPMTAVDVKTQVEQLTFISHRPKNICHDVLHGLTPSYQVHNAICSLNVGMVG